MTFTATIVHRIADLAAWAVASRRELVQHSLTFEECEALGLPEGSTERAVHVFPRVAAPRWRLGVWIVRDESEHSLSIDVLGHLIEVFYRPGSVSVPA